jgi:hypothetical protein
VPVTGTLPDTVASALALILGSAGPGMSR